MTLGLDIDRLVRIPRDLTTALRVVPEIAAQLREMNGKLDLIAGDTEALPPLRADMGRVAEATSVLSDVDLSLTTIKEAMPVLVEVQKHLDQLPVTMEGLDQGLDRLSSLLAQLMSSLEALDVDVETLSEEIGPFSRLASRFPGQRDRRRPE